MFKLLRFLKPYWWQVIILLISTGGQVYATLQLPALMADIINNGNYDSLEHYLKARGLISDLRNGN